MVIMKKIILLFITILPLVSLAQINQPPTSGAYNVGGTQTSIYRQGTGADARVRLFGGSAYGYYDLATGKQLSDSIKRRNYIDVDKQYGGNLKLALQQCPEYTTLIISNRRYNITGLYSHNFNLGAGPFIGNTKRGIVIQGTKMPSISTNGRRLEGGSVICGTLFNLADGFEVHNLGNDNGKDVIDSLYNGEFAEGLVMCANTSYPTPQPFIKNLIAENIISLGAIPTGDVNTFKHTWLVENGYGIRLSGKIISYGGYHGFAMKSLNVIADDIEIHSTVNDAMIIKSDPANQCGNVLIKNLIFDSWMYEGNEVLGGNLQLQADNTNGTNNIVIDNFQVRKMRPMDVVSQIGDYTLSNINFGNLYVNTPNVLGAVVRVGYSAPVNKFTIGYHSIVTGGRTFEFGNSAVDCNIGDGSQTFVDDAIINVMDLQGNVRTGKIFLNFQHSETATTLVVKGDNARVNYNDLQYSGPGIAGKTLFNSIDNFFTQNNGGNLGINVTTPDSWFHFKSPYSEIRSGFQNTSVAYWDEDVKYFRSRTGTLKLTLNNSDAVFTVPVSAPNINVEPNPFTVAQRNNDGSLRAAYFLSEAGGIETIPIKAIMALNTSTDNVLRKVDAASLNAFAVTAPFLSPNLQGIPTTVTPSAVDSTLQVANTKYIKDRIQDLKLQVKLKDTNGNTNWPRYSITSQGNTVQLSDDNTSWYWVHSDSNGARVSTPATVATDANGNRTITTTTGGTAL